MLEGVDFADSGEILMAFPLNAVDESRLFLDQGGLVGLELFVLALHIFEFG